MYEDERKKATVYTAVGSVICMLGVGLYSCIDDLLKKPNAPAADLHESKKTK
jgi:hypothetical protein